MCIRDSVKWIIRPRSSQYIPELHAQNPVDLGHFLDRWLPGASHKRVPQFSKDARDGSAVNIAIRAIQIAQRFVDSTQDRFADDPGVVGMCRSLQRHGKPQFEGHIEPGSSRGASVELDAREIVNGILRLSNQREDAVEPPLSERNFQGSARSKAEGADACNIGKQQIFESRIVWDVEKNRCGPIARLCGGSRLSFQFSRCHCGSGPPISRTQYFELRCPLSQGPGAASGAQCG